MSGCAIVAIACSTEGHLSLLSSAFGNKGAVINVSMYGFLWRHEFLVHLAHTKEYDCLTYVVR